MYGTLTITPRPITFKTRSTSWIYDGKEHSYTAFNTIYGLPLLSGHKLVVTESTKITDVGEKLNEFTAYKIVDRQGNDKTFCYMRFATEDDALRYVATAPVEQETLYYCAKPKRFDNMLRLLGKPTIGSLPGHIPRRFPLTGDFSAAAPFPQPIPC